MILDNKSTWRDVLRFAEQEDKSWTYVITGKPGPTGKTFLYKRLKTNGHNAVEISEDMSSLVNYCDNENHYVVDYINKTVLIVLNKRLCITTGKYPWGTNIHGGFVTTVSEKSIKNMYEDWIKENPHSDITTLYPETHFFSDKSISTSFLTYEIKKLFNKCLKEDLNVCLNTDKILFKNYFKK